MATMFQDHHVLQEQFSNHPVLALLSSADGFKINAASNRIYLPEDQVLAQALDRPPHLGDHLNSYTDNQRVFLNALRDSSDFDLANGQPPDTAALGRIRTQVDEFISTMKYAIANGDLWPSTGWQGNQTVYDNANNLFYGNYDSYRQTHAAGIADMRAFEIANKSTGARWYGIDSASDIATISAVDAQLNTGQRNGLNRVIKNLNIPRPASGWLAPRAISFTGEAQATSQVATGSLRGLTRNLHIPWVDVYTAGAGRFSEARSEGMSVAEANLEAARAASKELALSLLVTAGGLGLAAAGASGAVVAAAGVVTYAVIDTIWDDLADPLSEFGGALNAGDYERLAAASQAIFEGVGNWINNDVIPFANALAQAVANVPSEAAAFANDPQGYVRAMAEQIWNGSLGALREQYSNSEQLIGENLDWVTDSLQEAMPEELQAQLDHFIEEAGGSVGQVIEELRDIRNDVTAPSANVVDDVRVGNNGEIIINVREPGSTRGYDIVSRLGADGQYHETRRVYDLRGLGINVALPNLTRDILETTLQGVVGNLNAPSTRPSPFALEPAGELSLVIASQYRSQWDQFQWVPIESVRFGAGAQVRRLPAQIQNPQAVVYEVRDAAGNIVHRDVLTEFHEVENPLDGVNHLQEGTTILLDSSQNGVSRTLSLWDSGYSLSFGDGRQFNFDADSALDLDGNGVNVSWRDGDWTLGSSLTDASAFWANRDGLDLQFDWTLDGAGLSLSDAVMHGSTYTGGDAGQWFDTVQGNYNDTQSASGANTVGSSLTSEFSLISSYQTTGLAADLAELVTLAQSAEDNRGSLSYLAAGLDQQNSSDQFDPRTMGAHTQILASLSAAGARAVDAMLRATYGNITAAQMAAAARIPRGTVSVIELPSGAPQTKAPLVLDLDGRGLDLISYNDSTPPSM